MDILVVDDDSESLEAITDFLNNMLGHNVFSYTNGKDALKSFKQQHFPIVLTDIRMPQLSGLDLLTKIKLLPEGKQSDIILMTGFADIDSVIQALRRGAYDYLLKPINVEELAVVIDRAAEHRTLLNENLELTDRFEEKLSEATVETRSTLNYFQKAYFEITGVGEVGIFSKTMKQIHSLAEKFHQDRSIPVLIEGETGVGKEIIAHVVHYGQSNNDLPFVAINCAAIPANLFESELFGYEKGSYTGAKKEGAKGKLEMAQNGTLFLDEIGDLPLEIQPKLLRFLQDRSFYRVGGVKKIELDVRIICATNQDLKTLQDRGEFRQDLYYRIQTGSLQIPPLRERVEDIVPLARMFLKSDTDAKKSHFRSISKEAAKILTSYHWPGNIRELKSIIERIVLLYDDFEIQPNHLGLLDLETVETAKGNPNYLDPENIVLPPNSLDFNKLEATIVNRVLKKFNGNKTRSAAYLGLTRSMLRSRIKK